jgi:predicted nuclease with TOPRIM domain
MTLLGKIFTVLIFLMSIFFMAFSVAVYATHRNWREAVMRQTAEGPEKPLGLTHQKAQLKERIAELEDEKLDLQTRTDQERAARRQALASLEAQVAQLKTDLAAAEQRVVALSGEKTELIGLSAMKSQTLEALRSETVDLRGNVIVAQRERDIHLKNATALQDQIHQQRGQYARLNERNTQLTEQITKAKKVMGAFDITEDTPIDGIAPQLEGVVLAVSTRSGAVEVSVGSDDGLRENHEMDVSRKGAYIGRIQIKKTAPDRAVGIVVGSRKGMIMKGDTVRTRRD